MKSFGPALCGIARDQTLRATISANSKQNSKIFQGVNLGPRSDRLTKKEGRKSRDTVPLNTVYTNIPGIDKYSHSYLFYFR
jgi:hypothetical protein